MELTKEFMRLFDGPVANDNQYKDQRQEEERLMQYQSQTARETERHCNGFRFCLQPALHRCHNLLSQ